MGYKKRVIGLKMVDPASLTPHPQNWRRHPPAQMKAVRAMLDGVGWAGAVIVNKRTGRIIDGHARVEAAIEAGEAEIPVLHVDVPEESEKLLLASYDPIASMAEADQETLQALLADIRESVADEALLDALDVVHDTGDISGMLTEQHEGQKAASLVATLTIPPKVWLTQRAEVVSAIEEAAAQFGCTLEWPE